MSHVADFAFAVFAVMHEPLGWGAALAALLLGATRQRWWSTLLLAGGSTISGVAVLSVSQQQSGILMLRAWLDVPPFYVVFCIICGMGWVLGRAAALLVPRAMSIRS